ncbi:MAG: hypothetical protein AAF226_05690 [Verrucomicrobiota bacterium]
MSDKRNLPRLDRSAYRGRAVVHWVFNVADRKTGWLNEPFFLEFQLAATHTFARYDLVSPCICLMPDHIHLLVMGVDERGSDQKVAIPFLRRHLGDAFPEGMGLQKTPYDHVLRSEERKQGAFMKMAGYVRENPLRAGLVDSSQAWPYECAIVPGYPKMDVRDENFWETFWKIYYKQLK